MKLKQLEQELSSIPPFESPKIQFEQYPTTAHLASHMLFNAAGFGDIDNRSVVDLGIGCGMLTCASIMLGSSYNLGIDIDPDAIRQARRNCEEFGEVDLVNVNLTNWNYSKLRADTVIMNPPFGTKAKGIDMEFLRVASEIAETAVYTLHKTSTREHVLRKGEQLGMKGQVVAQLVYDLDNTYKFHKKKSVAIEVDFIRFEKQI
jgi:predicted RNA methylase